MNGFHESNESAGLAEDYCKHRPIYAIEKAERVFEFYRKHNQHKKILMLDIGSRKGRSANVF